MKKDIIYGDNTIDVSKEVNFIWDIANKLRGAYKSDKYKDVIIPMLIIRRFESALEDTKEDVLKAFDYYGDIPEVLCSRANQQFYNTSKFTLKELLNDADNIRINFESYLNSFSSNVQGIINNLKFNAEIEKLDKSNRLYGIIKAFSELDLNPKTVNNIKMGYMFEDIIRRFSENAEAGDHYTPREVIQLMVNLLLAEGEEDLISDGKIVTVLDMACGTGGMLSVTEEYLRKLNPNLDVVLFGQEINDESHAICLADMLIKGQDASKIVMQDTMAKDAFADQKMRYVIANPPFGESWAKDPRVEKIVRQEHTDLGFRGRFGAGLPTTADMQLLFMQHAVAKMDEKEGRAAIITNGSPLFSGGTTSGESQIRKWLLENDYIDSIIGLPTDLFYNTGIAIYVFVLSKNKSEERKGKVQLIDATSMYSKLRKSLGSKRHELTRDDIRKITELYANFEENEYCKIYDYTEFLYKEITIQQPLQLNFQITEERIENIYNETTFKNLCKEEEYEELFELEPRTAKEEAKFKKLVEGKALQNKIVEVLKQNRSSVIYKNREEFIGVLKELLKEVPEVKGSLLKAIYMGLSERDKTADIYKNSKGKVEVDTSLKDVELVPYNKDHESYFNTEVLKYVPDGIMEYDDKIGAEIPFTRHFYKYEKPRSTSSLQEEFEKIDNELQAIVKELFE